MALHLNKLSRKSEQIKDIGISTAIRYNDEKYASYVRVFPHVENSFIVTSSQLVSETNDVTLYKDPTNNEWKIFAVGAAIEPILKE